jgi:hypothetical protein
VGPLATPDGGSAGEPDGVGGIGRRGPFERLLATEWALADEAPDEFLRRAVTAELSFTELSHRRPATARRSVVLFDAGPDQLGAPRVVHLAALLLLAQRAADAGASFAWGVLQDPEGTLVSAVTQASVLGLLQKRSTRQVSAEDARRFRDALGPGETEVWLVGGPEAAATCQDLTRRRLEIEDSFDPAAPMSVDVRAFVDGTATPRVVRLDLPPAALAVRLLRDPFGAVSAARPGGGAAFAPGTNIVFGGDDRKIYLRGAGGELVTVCVPRSPRSKEMPKPRMFRPPAGEVLVGVGERREREGKFAVTQRDGELLVHTLSKRGGASVRCARFRRETPVDVSAQLGLLCPLGDEVFIFCDTLGRTFHLRHGEADLDTNVFALRHGYADLLVINADPPGAEVISFAKDKRAIERCPLAVLSDEKVLGAVLGPRRIIALRTADETWLLVDWEKDLEQRRRTRPGDEVIGVVDGPQPSRAGLIVLDATRKRIERIEADAVETWVTSAAPIAYARVSDMNGHIAYITSEGALCVHEPCERAMVLRLLPGAT